MTNRIIKAKFLRRAMAKELWQASRYRHTIFDSEHWAAFRFGLESGFWAIQKELL